MSPSIPRRHVLLVGIDLYAAVDPLHGSVNDVDAIEAVLLDRLNVLPLAITKLVSPHPWQERRPRLPEREPTYANIRAALDALAGNVVEPGDRVLIYYSGHGTQVLPRGEKVAREALVPSDMHDGGALLYDCEINEALWRIAQRTQDVTVVLDCCCSAGATRSALRLPDSAVRFCWIDRPPPPPLIFRQMRPGDPVVAAACQSHESASEGASDLGRRHGALTAALLGVLAAQPDGRLDTLRWGDFWHSLGERISARYPDQHPWLTGRAERRLFGGPFRPQDFGFPVSSLILSRSHAPISDDLAPTFAEGAAGICVAAGTMVGLTRGAKVAVYGPMPDFFPPFGSVNDLAARIGVLEVKEATSSSCIAAPIGGPLALVQGARGRLIELGEHDELVVQLDPYDAELARWLEHEGRLRVVPAARPPGDVGLVEVFVGQGAEGWRWIGDAIFGNDAAGHGEAPLAWVPGNDREALLLGLLHYTRYNLALRLSRRCRDLPGALRVRILDCRDLSGLRGPALQDPPLPEVRADPGGRYRYCVEHGQPICVVVENRSSERLFANLLNCATSGRVEMVGTTQIELPPGRSQVFWQPSRIGEAFRCELPEGRASGVDRLIAVASTVPSVDLSFLEVKRSFEEAIRARFRDLPPVQPEPRELWTASLVTMKIVRYPPMT